MYAESTWIAPVFARSAALHRVGGLHVGLVRGKEPGFSHKRVLGLGFAHEGGQFGTGVGKPAGAPAVVREQIVR